MWSELSGAALTGLLGSSLALTAPYLYASLAQTLEQRSGVLDFSTEGTVLLAAVSAYALLLSGGAAWGVVLALGAGVLMSLVAALLSVTLALTRGAATFGLYLVGLGMSRLLLTSPRFQVVVDAPLERSTGDLSSALIYGAYVLVPTVWFVLERTAFGLKLRAAGAEPAVAEASGVNVVRTRYLSLVIGGALAGLAGATLALSLSALTEPNPAGGLGFIAFALARVCAGRPLRVLVGALSFGVLSALQLWLREAWTGSVPAAGLISLAPYLLVLLLLGYAGRSGAGATRPEKAP